MSAHYLKISQIADGLVLK